MAHSIVKTPPTGSRLAATLILLLTAFISQSALAGFMEGFEDEADEATTFSETGGPDFNLDGDLMVEFFAGLGSGGSNYWLGTGYGFSGNGSGGSSGNVGTMTVESGWSFMLNSFDAWTGQADGNGFLAGDIKLIGTKLDNSIVEHIFSVPTVNDTDFITGLSTSGTSFAGMALASVSFELITGAPLDYLAIDNIDYEASRLPRVSVPLPSTLALLCAGWLLVIRRGRSARTHKA